jgi:hypothetical protein
MTDGLSSYGVHGSSLRSLARLRRARRHRASSWDRSGGNRDYWLVESGATSVLADLPGAGSITHIWCTMGHAPGGNAVMSAEPLVELALLRRVLLRITWDGGEHPSVLVPLGDFFGVGHGRTANFVSAPLQMSPEDGRGFNCWFHMPFAQGARVELVNEADDPVAFFFYADYEIYDELGEDLGRFHAQWRRENPTDGVPRGSQTVDEFLDQGVNLDGAGNYTILEAEGRGHYVGCVLNVHNLHEEIEEGNWYGEGDDMIFIDGEPFPPSLHGTGTEDYFNTAWCPTQTYSAPYHGLTLPGGPNWSGLISTYRFHIEDPVTFERSIRVTIEHGHANKRCDDLSSVAYWYQALPHKPFGIAPVQERLPRAVPA